MKYPSGKTSTWLALQNPVYSKLWFAMVISGSSMAAQNTAIYWALNALGATTVLISLMATVSALPGALFTLPAGAIADIVNRKKISKGRKAEDGTIDPKYPLKESPSASYL